MGLDTNHPDYVELRSRIRENPTEFVAMVGAGLSRPCGLLRWGELRDEIVKEAKARQADQLESERTIYLQQLDRIGSEKDLWRAFSSLRKLLSHQAYENAIRTRLTRNPKLPIPSTYIQLWKLRIKGIVTFNLDTCAVDSFSREMGIAVDNATSKESARFSRYLSGPQHFVFQPHGIITDSSSWVFTEQEKTELLRNEPYVSFMRSMFQSKHLLLLGYNPDDFTFQYLLEQALLTPTGTGSKHYVLLPNPSVEQIHSLGDKGVGVIPYAPEDRDSHREIEEALNDILSFLPADAIPHTVFEGTPSAPTDLPSDAEMMRMPIEESRKLLNAAISAILPSDRVPTDADVDNLEKFYDEHLGAIHLAWLVDPNNSSYNTLYGYKIISELGRGAFGQVYEVEHVLSKERGAVKILLPDVRKKRDYLNSFRRGVHSMKILTNRKVGKMVQIKDAYEVPACLFMEYVDGLTLTEAKNRGALGSLDRCLDALVQVGEVVHAAHSLKERVLHRDLKPDNVILRSLYSNTDSIDAVVLDFDLSWYKGASELSVVHGARAQGYAAPEQTAIGRKTGVSTRHVAVDVFGFGMLAFFLFSGSDPMPNQQRFPGFESELRETIARKFSSRWRCLPSYLAYLVRNCTRDVQSDRMDFSSAVEGFRTAYHMITAETIRSTEPLLLWELAARIDSSAIPIVSDYGRQMNVKSPDGSKDVELSLENRGERIYLKADLKKVRSGEDSRFVPKYLDKVKDKTIARLNFSPFEGTGFEKGQSSLRVYTYWPLPKDVSLKVIDDVASKLVDARAAMSFG
jgi:eukaryotic-like serine/threonine-protein kinase